MPAGATGPGHCSRLLVAPLSPTPLTDSRGAVPRGQRGPGASQEPKSKVRAEHGEGAPRGEWQLDTGSEADAQAGGQPPAGSSRPRAQLSRTFCGRNKRSFQTQETSNEKTEGSSGVGGPAVGSVEGFTKGHAGSRAVCVETVRVSFTSSL